MTVLRRFGRFWVEFVVGDDVGLAAGVAVALGASAALAAAALPAWWFLPLAVVALLAASVRRASRSRER
jgi:hypothetical protein